MQDRRPSRRPRKSGAQKPRKTSMRDELYTRHVPGGSLTGSPTGIKSRGARLGNRRGRYVFGRSKKREKRACSPSSVVKVSDPLPIRRRFPSRPVEKKISGESKNRKRIKKSFNNINLPHVI